MTMYDRSWYGCVLVERVEGFAGRIEWLRSYEEINHFEEQLTNHGTAVVKFWVHISFEEQLKRFQERQGNELKKYKITEEDWRNRDRWNDYEHAINDMIVHTSTEFAPWKLIPANDKRVARVEILKTLCQRLEQALDK